jgi:hypothetical protein
MVPTRWPIYMTLLVASATAWADMIPPKLRPEVLRPDAAALKDAPQSFPVEDWDALLRKYVDDQGRVDYPALAKADLPAFERVFAAVAASSPRAEADRYPTRGAREAYYLNAYNVLVWKYVLTRTHKLLSIDVVSHVFFEVARFFVGGRETTLDELEKAIRGKFKDPRVHMALNCAAAGCPLLPRQAFKPEALERQLDRAARRFVAEKRNVDYDAAKQVVHLSRLFDWYGEDFGTEPVKVLGWINRYRAASAQLPLDARIEYVEYDWRLNDRSLRR